LLKVELKRQNQIKSINTLEVQSWLQVRISYILLLPSYRVTCYWLFLRTYHSFENWMHLCFIPYLGWHFTSLNMLPVPLDLLFLIAPSVFSNVYLYTTTKHKYVFFFYFQLLLLCVVIRMYCGVPK
jgi:hypothetical protein